MSKDKLYNRRSTPGTNKSVFGEIVGQEKKTDTATQQPVNTGIQQHSNTAIQVPVPKEEVKKKKATFNMDLDLHKRLRTFAATQDQTMIEVLEIALTKYMDEVEKK